ncbi:hypothetical protein [Hydrogenophaga crocea]|uniref:Uncharacterized protein n=1 Tax=Hydrogenophaga crocea TaxID=2716225 RepID=A0A6G8IEW7_9BURK|nr:hypothetical protein [Hydrogenophaga crocea]QIM51608.1 hypothetical protein G9Q37_05370 [Hydrogenophaga crocea]
MSEEHKLDKFHKHEALDRAWIMFQMVNDWLVDHPYIEADAVLSPMAGAASQALWNLYQEIGAREEMGIPRCDVVPLPVINMPEESDLMRSLSRRAAGGGE